MGVYSEMDMERHFGDRHYSDYSAHSIPEVQESPAWDEAPAVAQPAFEDDERQQAEAEAAPAILARLNEEQDDGSKDPAEAPALSKDTTDDGGDEDAKRKAHEEAEAKRKAEFDAKQTAKKAAMQEQLDRLNGMDDQDVMMESMKRVSADTEKITRRNMKDCVSEHIQTLCLDDPAFARRVMHPKKSMIHCFQYISRKAWEYVQDELKADGIQPGTGPQGYGCDIPDNLCYQWAVDYFNDPDAKEDQEEEEKFVPKPYLGSSTKAKPKSKAKAKNETAKKSAEKPKADPKPKDDDGQISLLGVA